ncbi:formate/nitrite transporter family protein [Halomarina ordinaria]|uniref:Formate/nitrite transporter family protein n=1 Tax=Halomarina ordinaria TaxID=3033939 RepID=A0ABD5U485_9EURY|nr:formate/nitrite transporter family protein [Halomarina sp. PSRA2]
MTSTPRDPESEVRDAVDRSQSGAPADGKVIRDRFSADEIFQRVIVSADEEIDATTRELFFSGLAAGFAITLAFLLHAVVTAAVPGPMGPTVGAVLYPIGFVYIIIGRYQLYTENTLPPVALVLTRLTSVPALLRIWVVVLCANAVGAALGALVLSQTGVFSPPAAAVAVGFGTEALETSWWDLFAKALFAGWLVAGLVWLEHASRDTISRIVLVYVIFLCIPVGGLYHSVVSICDAFYLAFETGTGILPVLWEFVTPVVLGNTVGGVFLVTLVNYMQTRDRYPEPLAERPTLSLRQWLVGWGRSPRVDRSD